MLYHKLNPPAGAAAPPTQVEKNEKLDPNRHGYDGQVTGLPVGGFKPSLQYTILYYQSGCPQLWGQTNVLEDLLGDDGDARRIDNASIYLTPHQTAAQLGFGVPFVWAYGVGSADYAIFLTERAAEVLPLLPATNYGWDYAGRID